MTEQSHAHHTLEHPRYKVAEFTTPKSAETWLAQVAEQNYRFVSMATLSTTNHFSKEIESEVWIVVELQNDPPPTH